MHASHTDHLRVALWVIALSAFTLLSNYSGLDIALSQLVFDESSNAFPLRENGVLSILLHDGMKRLITALWLGLLVLTGIVWLKQSREPGADRSTFRLLAYIVLAAGLSAVLTSVLKSLSHHSCPWDLTLFGGAAQFYPLLGRMPMLADGSPAGGPGKCFPSGHASTGWMWLCVLFAAHKAPVGSWMKKGQRYLTAGVISLGSLVSAVQISRGAHFLSHTLATIVICLLIAWGLDAVLLSLPGEMYSE